MTLYDYLKKAKDDEVVVHDTDYDTESYWYFNDESENNDDFDLSLMKLARAFKVESINNNSLNCNISEVLEPKLKDLKQSRLISKDCDIDDIMYEFDGIIGGYTSEEWLVEFTEIIIK